MSNNRYAQVFAIMKAKGIKADILPDLVLASSGMTTSLKELDDKQLSSLIRTLNNADKRISAGDVMRKKVISILAAMEEYKGEIHHYNFVAYGTRTPQMGGINGIYVFINRVGYLKKPLNEYTTVELQKLVTQMQEFRKNVWGRQADKAVAELQAELA